MEKALKRAEEEERNELEHVDTLDVQFMAEFGEASVEEV